MDYDKYINEITKYKIECLSKSKVDKLYEKLLLLIPNNGRLYKYRSFNSDKIDKYIEALENHYIWIPKAAVMEDKDDSSLQIKIGADVADFKEFVKKEPYIVFKAFCKRFDIFKQYKIEIPKDKFDDLIKCIDMKTGKIKKANLAARYKKYSQDFKKALMDVEKVQDAIKNFIEENEDLFVNFLNNLASFSDEQREKIGIYSLCVRYNSDKMWENYCENNGFCIEYDFNKALNLSTDVKRNLLLTLRVDYYDELKRFSVFDILKAIICDEVDDKFNNDQSKLILQQVLSKKSCYSFEEEWRIIQYKLENMFSADLVSSIIIDEDSLEEETAKRLISIANNDDNKWNVIIRTFDKNKNEYYYKKYQKE